jgi:predicted ABC-type ATPase
VKVVDEGEDGMLVEDATGRRRYVHDPVGAIAPTMAKARGPVVLMMGTHESLLKATRKGAPGLTLQNVTDRAGHATKRWKKSGAEQPKKREAAAADDGAGSAHGYGTHNLGRGDHVAFKMGTLEGEGEIVSAGEVGATVKDSEGHPHKVRWEHVTGHKGGSSDASKAHAAKTAAEPKPRAEQTPREADAFSASDYASEHDEQDATAESIISGFPPDTAAKIKAVQQRLQSIEQTIETHKSGSAYAAERAQLHASIVGQFLSPEKLAAATPENGEKPVLTLLGGRGGSGKSAFNGEKHPAAKVYDKSKAIVVDADEVKALLPEYEGWNAHQVHEESSDILEAIIEGAKRAGANLVIDATMKTEGGTLSKVDAFEEAGYDIHAHYMHLPRQEAAKRAVARFLGKTQRYVPVDVVLSNTGNEKVFDKVRERAKVWSFMDNNVPEGHPPIMISKSGG